eukprot:CAMPEP_0184872620 /NCGR_PEP_ID=MMETSP0580-20130426/41396_1 /TAXON_ID=1118495 /ORGANISM="Dactyliosolen fragilissimus" /LENGTH=554 /DNA_ID=CAMNT_0027375451 /DNA_START=17 /DNA_END=1678 /DNA_ORIENTATION=-
MIPKSTLPLGVQAPDSKSLRALELNELREKKLAKNQREKYVSNGTFRTPEEAKAYIQECHTKMKTRNPTPVAPFNISTAESNEIYKKHKAMETEQRKKREEAENFLRSYRSTGPLKFDVNVGSLSQNYNSCDLDVHCKRNTPNAEPKNVEIPSREEDTKEQRQINRECNDDPHLGNKSVLIDEGTPSTEEHINTSVGMSDCDNIESQNTSTLEENFPDEGQSYQIEESQKDNYDKGSVHGIIHNNISSTSKNEPIHDLDEHCRYVAGNMENLENEHDGISSGSEEYQMVAQVNDELDHISHGTSEGSELFEIIDTENDVKENINISFTDNDDITTDIEHDDHNIATNMEDDKETSVPRHHMAGSKEKHLKVTSVPKDIDIITAVAEDNEKFEKTKSGQDLIMTSVNNSNLVTKKRDDIFTQIESIDSIKHNCETQNSKNDVSQTLPVDQGIPEVIGEKSYVEKWNDEYQRILRQRDNDENVVKEMCLSRAKEHLVEAKIRREKIRMAKASINKNKEEERLKSIEADLENDISWNRVVKMIDLSQNESCTDCDRM